MVVGACALVVLVGFCTRQLAACVPDNPTPAVKWDLIPGTANPPVLGDSLLYRLPGGTWQLLRQFPVEWNDIDEDGTNETRFRRGVDLPVPVQRYCPSCQPLSLYEFSVQSYTSAGTYGNQTNFVSVCFPKLCVRGSPCN